MSALFISACNSAATLQLATANTANSAAKNASFTKTDERPVGSVDSAKKLSLAAAIVPSEHLGNECMLSALSGRLARLLPSLDHFL